jgi:hypothetical protein
VVNTITRAPMVAAYRIGEPGSRVRRGFLPCAPRERDTCQNASQKTRPHNSPRALWMGRAVRWSLHLSPIALKRLGRRRICRDTDASSLGGAIIDLLDVAVKNIN